MVLEPNVDALDPGDLVIAVDGVALGGLAYDQVEQAGLVGLSGGMGVREVLLWRARASALEQVAIPEPSSEVEAAPSLETLRIATSGGVVLALHVPEVRDDFAAQLEAALAAPALQGVAGILVDLRGNAGGSLEAARDAAGLWIGTAPVAVLRRRNGETEVLRSSSDRAIPELPVAVLVDGDTASAAEVFAGALRAHGVATLVGTKTFGKGCAQQYLRDAAGRGVLRVTTDVISLADGSALQQVGLSPDLELASEAAGEEAAERESDRPGVPQSWSGPALIARAPEPRPWGLGRPRGACPEPGLCRALSALAVHRGVRVR